MITKHPTRSSVFTDGGGGDSIASYEAYEVLKETAGEVVEAELSFDERGELTEPFDFTGEPATMVLRFEDGSELWLSGCCCGAGTTGSHYAAQILRDAGFAEEIIDAVPHAHRMSAYRDRRDISVPRQILGG